MFAPMAAGVYFSKDKTSATTGAIASMAAAAIGLSLAGPVGAFLGGLLGGYIGLEGAKAIGFTDEFWGGLFGNDKAAQEEAKAELEKAAQDFYNSMSGPEPTFGVPPSTLTPQEANQMTGPEFGFTTVSDNPGALGGVPGDPNSGDDTGSGYESDPLGGVPGDPNSGDDTGPGYESDPLGGDPNNPDAGDDTGPGDPGGDPGGGKPIVLDLDGDGVELAALEDSTAFYDINGDGYRERMAWASADDGFLAYDKDGDGVISAHDELSFVSYVEGAETDLEGLAHFDTNGNGKLDSGDADWSKFRVWQDLDQDGVSDAGELRTLDEAGITEISLTSDE